MKKRIRDCSCNDFNNCGECPLNKHTKKHLKEHDFTFCDLLGVIRDSSRKISFIDNVNAVVECINEFNQICDNEIEVKR